MAHNTLVFEIEGELRPTRRRVGFACGPSSTSRDRQRRDRRQRKPVDAASALLRPASCASCANGRRVRAQVSQGSPGRKGLEAFECVDPVRRARSARGVQLPRGARPAQARRRVPALHPASARDGLPELSRADAVDGGRPVRARYGRRDTPTTSRPRATVLGKSHRRKASRRRAVSSRARVALADHALQRSRVPAERGGARGSPGAGCHQGHRRDSTRLRLHAMGFDTTQFAKIPLDRLALHLPGGEDLPGRLVTSR